MDVEGLDDYIELFHPNPIYNRPYSKKASEIENLKELLESMTKNEKLRAIEDINKQLGIKQIKKEIL